MSKHKQKVPKLTSKKIRELLKQAAPGAQELKRELDKYFFRPYGVNLVLK